MKDKAITTNSTFVHGPSVKRKKMSKCEHGKRMDEYCFKCAMVMAGATQDPFKYARSPRKG